MAVAIAHPIVACLMPLGAKVSVVRRADHTTIVLSVGGRLSFLRISNKDSASLGAFLSQPLVTINPNSS